MLLKSLERVEFALYAKRHKSKVKTPNAAPQVVKYIADF